MLQEHETNIREFLKDWRKLKRSFQEMSEPDGIAEAENGNQTEKINSTVTRLVGSSKTFLVACGFLALWFPIVLLLDWPLTMVNTPLGIIIFLMVFVLQYNQSKMKQKLDGIMKQLALVATSPAESVGYIQASRTDSGDNMPSNTEKTPAVVPTELETTEGSESQKQTQKDLAEAKSGSAEKLRILIEAARVKENEVENPK